VIEKMENKEKTTTVVPSSTHRAVWLALSHDGPVLVIAMMLKSGQAYDIHGTRYQEKEIIVYLFPFTNSMIGAE